MFKSKDGPSFPLRSTLGAAALAALLAGCGGSSGTGPVNGTVNSGSPSLGLGTVSPAAPPDPNGADWPQYSRDSQHTRNSPQTLITMANVATLAPKWGTGTSHPTPPLATYADPVVMNGLVYQAGLNGYLYALDINTGAQRWAFSPTYTTSMKTTPTYYHGTLYTGDMGSTHQNGTFYSINASTGHANWQYVSPDPLGHFDGSPIVSGSTVYIGSSAVNEVPGKCVHQRQLVGFSLFSPVLVASMNLTPPPQNGADIWSTPMLDTQGNMYITTGNECTPNFNQSFPYANAIIRTKANPQLGVQWSYQIPSGPGLDLDFGSSAVYVNGVVIAGSKDGYTYAVNANTGALLWRAATGSVIGALATDGTRVYVPSFQTVYPACTPGQLCGGLTAVNIADGSIAWSIPATADKYGQGVRASPVYSNGMVFGAWNGALWAVDALTGHTLWTYAVTGNIIYGGITLVNGGLITGTQDATKYWCFTPGGK